MPTQKSRDTVLALFQREEEEYGAFDLLKVLKDNGMSESEIKEALAYLINDHQLEMTPDLRVRSAQVQVHA